MTVKKFVVSTDVTDLGRLNRYSHEFVHNFERRGNPCGCPIYFVIFVFFVIE